MRMTLISMLTVALLAVGLCLTSLFVIEHAAGEADRMRVEVLDLIDQGDIPQAQLRLRQLAEAWSRHEDALAILASHDSLHEITGLIIEGSANLDAGDLDDFTRSMALLGEAIRHLHEDERLRIANIL